MQKPLINNQIEAKEVRLIDENGKQIGILPLEKALQVAKDKGLDLVQVTEKIEPPVCRLTDYGKYLYWIQKKREAKKQNRIESDKVGI